MNRTLLASLIGAAMVLAPGMGHAPAQNADAAAHGPTAARPAAGAKPEVSFAFERVGLAVPSFTLTISEDGHGIYKGRQVSSATNSATALTSADEFDRKFPVSAETVRKIFGLADRLHRFNVPCASKAKNIADTGKKTLTFSGPDGATSCTYNFTENKDVQSLTDVFQGIAETLDQGRSLDHLHRYDRLGLDAALEFLTQEVTAGHALEIGTIETSLRSIAGDADVMQRVRTRANALLARVPAD